MATMLKNWWALYRIMGEVTVATSIFHMHSNINIDGVFQALGNMVVRLWFHVELRTQVQMHRGRYRWVSCSLPDQSLKQKSQGEHWKQGAIYTGEYRLMKYGNRSKCGSGNTPETQIKTRQGKVKQYTKHMGQGLPGKQEIKLKETWHNGDRTELMH